MKRPKQKYKASNKKNSKQPTQIQAREQVSARRGFFKKIRNGVLATLIIGAVGWFVVDDVKATMQEHDLTRIGNGTPAVVQIHDPQCPKCLALQRETRDAMDNFESGQLQYIVANIRSPEGRALATKHNVSHVTLLIFDARGKKRQVLTGPNQSSHLTDVFRQHLTKFGNS